MSGMNRTLIVGGGASGLLVAIHLAKRATTSNLVHLAEPREILGQGLAYSTDDGGHLLNVPAGRMSAFADDPEHFVRWTGRDSNYFAPRKDYGQYLIDTFEEVRVASRSTTFEHIRKEVDSLNLKDAKWVARFKDGDIIEYDIVVLAMGHGKPIELSSLSEIEPDENYVSDPWRYANVARDGTLIGIGTGLTFIDLALSHLKRNSSNKVIGISRNGLLPEAHLPKRAQPLPVPAAAKTSPTEMRKFIDESTDWRAAQDGVRHELPDIWHSWSVELKQEFFTNHLRWWNVHRHRVSPEIQEEVSQALNSGRLTILAAEIESIEKNEGSFNLKTKSGERLIADALVNCLGYSAWGKDSLLGQLIDSGLAKAAPLSLGMCSDFPKFNVVDENEKPHRNLFAIGPVLLGERFETTAIPELKEQAQEVAKEVSEFVL